MTLADVAPNDVDFSLDAVAPEEPSEVGEQPDASRLNERITEQATMNLGCLGMGISYRIDGVYAVMVDRI